MNKEIQQAIENKQRRIDRAIDIKQKSIAYFNSVNSAISLIAVIRGKKEAIDTGNITNDLIKLRDWFYQQWQEWYLDSIEPEKNNEELPL